MNSQRWIALLAMAAALCSCSHHVATTRPGVPPSRHSRVVVHLRATMAGADDIDLDRPLFARAERGACGHLLHVQPSIRFLGPRRWLLGVPCGGAKGGRQHVLVRFVDVHVPDMVGPVFARMQGVTNMLGLRLRV